MGMMDLVGNMVVDSVDKSLSVVGMFCILKESSGVLAMMGKVFFVMVRGISGIYRELA